MALTEKQLQILDAIVFLIRKGVLPTVREIRDTVGLSSPATVAKHLKALTAAGLITSSGKSRGIRIADPALLESLREPVESGAPGESSEAPDPNILRAHFPEAPLGSGSLPIVGAIAAGQPIERIEPTDPLDIQPALAIDPRMFAASGDLVALRVEGDSMIDAGILDGDYVVIRRQETVENGEIAAVLVDGEGTLKRMYHIKSGNGPSAAPSGGTGGPKSTAEIDALFEDADSAGVPADPEDLTDSVRLKAANERFDPIVVHESDRKEVLVFGKYVGLVRGDLRIL